MCVCVQISCGSFHSLLLTAKGTVYSWGSNVHGQLGHPQIHEMVYIRNTRVKTFEECRNGSAPFAAHGHTNTEVLV